MYLPSALALAITLALAANANAHDATDAPFCHEPAADEWPTCRIYAGELPAQPDPAPTRVPCPSGYASHLNCYEIGYWDEAPSGRELAAISLRDNGSRDAVVIRVNWHRASGDSAPWNDGLPRSANHHRSDGDRASRNAGSADQGQQRDQEVSRDEPRAEPQPAPAPPMNNGPMMGPGD